MDDFITMSQEDFNKAIAIANEQGREGKKIRLYYIHPKTATEQGGTFAIEDTTPKTATET